MAPAENPTVVILVVMDEPTGGARDGGQVSAPVFREIAEQILPEMNIVPDGQIVKQDLTPETIPEEVEPSDVKMPTDDANEEVKTETKKAVEKTIKTEKIKETANVKTVEKETKKDSKKEEKPDANKKAAKLRETETKSEKPKADLKNKSSTDKVKKKT